MFYENYACGSQRNYTGYCKEEMMALFEKQSMMDDGPERLKLVYEIDKKLQEDAARPIIAITSVIIAFSLTLKALRL